MHIASKNLRLIAIITFLFFVFLAGHSFYKRYQQIQAREKILEFLQQQECTAANACDCDKNSKVYLFEQFEGPKDLQFIGYIYNSCGYKRRKFIFNRSLTMMRVVPI
jgi:hypothetical protein